MLQTVLKINWTDCFKNEEEFRRWMRREVCITLCIVGSRVQLTWHLVRRECLPRTIIGYMIVNISRGRLRLRLTEQIVKIVNDVGCKD